jgi:hypothetical protein
MTLDISKPPHVVWHVAGMGNWKEVIAEQIGVLVDAGLTSGIRITYLGEEEEFLRYCLDEARLSYDIVASDPNLHHCETLAILEVEKLAKVEKTDRPILYFHTKGVSNPGDWGKQQWRRLMQAHVISQWQINLLHLLDHDAVGVNWIEGGTQHFSGTFWIANPNWIRRLPGFSDYHASRGRDRYSCEMWIGAMQWCKAKSLACKNEPFWNSWYDFGRLMPSPVRGSFDYRGTQADQPEAVIRVIPPFVKEVMPARVLEIGTGHGGFIRLVRHALNDLAWDAVPTMSVDVVHRESMYVAQQEGTEVLILNPFDPEYKTVAPEVVRYVTQPGKTLIFCDGGNPGMEFQALARIAKVGDVVCVHDYAPNPAYFRTKLEGRVWNWLETTDETIARSVQKYGMAKLDEDALQKGMWGAFEKTTNGETYDVTLPPIAGKIGIGMVTYNRPHYFKQAVTSLVKVLDKVDMALIYNDGSPSGKDYYGIYSGLPDKLRVCHADRNRGVAFAKNYVMQAMLDARCEFIFVMEDDVTITDGRVFEAYIRAHVPRAVEHMNFAHHGSANASGPVGKLNDRISLFPNVVGAFSFYTNHALRTCGLMETGFNNCWEHVEHTARLAEHGLTTDFFKFADLSNSLDYINEIPGAVENSSIRVSPDWEDKVREGLRYWKENLTTHCPVTL